MSVTHAGVHGRTGGGAPTAVLVPSRAFDTEYAAALGLLPAPTGRRWVAFIIDLSFMIVLAIPAVIAAAALAGYMLTANEIDAFGEPGFVVNLILLAAGVLMVAAGIVLQCIAHRRMGVTFGKVFVGIRSVNAVRFGRRGTWLIDVINGVNPYNERAMRRAQRHIGESERDATPEEALPPLTAEPKRGNADLSPLFSPGFRLLAASGTHERAGAGGQSGSDAPARAMITFDSGVRYTVAQAGLIGRTPHTAAGESGMELVSVVDDSLSISKTHAEFGIDDRGFWIGDRGSRNGTAIRSVDGASAAVHPGMRAYVRSGDTVFLGARSFVVDRVDGECSPSTRRRAPV